MGMRLWTVSVSLAVVGCGASPNTPTEQPKTEMLGETPPVVKSQERHSFTDPKGRFSVTFPTGPASIPPPQEVNVRPDKPIQLAIWAAEDGDTKYILSVTYAPADFLDTTFDLETFGQAENPHWRVERHRSVTIDGQAGKQIEYTANDGMRSSVSVFTRFKGTVVSMSVNGPRGVTAGSKEAKEYFGSFRFTR
jgi:hypothetical protein